MRLAGVEPAAQSLGNSCSIQVSYRRVIKLSWMCVPAKILGGSATICGGSYRRSQPLVISVDKVTVTLFVTVTLSKSAMLRQT